MQKEKTCTCVTKQDGVVYSTMDYTTKEECSTEVNQSVSGISQTMTCTEK